MLCSISGTVPEVPVVSKKSGHLYEKRLILKVIKETGRDPVTSEALGEDDLLELTTSQAVKPRPTPATSIPGLLSLFQNEWDATMLEVHQLRQSLNTVRQELSHALYQHDAACRVIARLVRERDGYRQQLEAAQKAAPQEAPAGGKRGADGEAMDVEEPAGKKAKAGITPDIAEKLTACSNELSKGRKKRAISPTVATPEEIAAFSLQSSQPLHKTSKGGILAMDLSPASEMVVATAGADTTVQLFDRASERVLASLKGHSKKVYDVKFVGGQELLASASADCTTKLWKAEGEGYACAHTFSEQGGEVVSVCVHPSKDFLITAAGDGSWCFYDVAQAACVAQVADDAAAAGGGYSCAALHPDGLILCTGTTDAAVRIWETRTQKNVAKFDGHEGRINGISFSENGYYMATCASDGVKLWDLRKLRNFKSLAPYAEGGAATAAVAFDHSGLYLAVGGADARVYGVKQDWAVVKEFAQQQVAELKQPPPGLRNEDLPALFWDELPEDDTDNPDAAAIKSIMEETTPEEQAAGFKNMGNDALKAGLRHRKKFYLRQAIEQYGKGLDVQCADAELNSILCSNRAHVNLLLGNFRNAYQDGLAALRHNELNVKAFYRAAKGAMGLRKYDRCRELCAAGLALDAANRELKDLSRRAAVEKDAQAARDAAEEARQERIRSPARRLAETVLSHGWHVGRPQFTIGERRPAVDEEGLVHWPALFFYPEAGMQQDSVDDVCEEDTFKDHLDLMYGPEAPPLDWDSRGEYSRRNIEVYYLSHSATPLSLDQLTEAFFGSWPDVAEEGPQRYGPNAAKWVRVKENWTLRDALARPDHIVPGVPTFFVLAKGTDFRDRFLEGDIPLL